MPLKNIPTPTTYYRCAGPNCGAVKGTSNHGWIMWTSYEGFDVPVLFLAPWDEKLALREGALYVCGESCAQKLQSQFMGNVRENEEKKNNGE